MKNSSECKYGGISFSVLLRSITARTLAWQHSSESISQEKRYGNGLSCENMKADIFRIYDVDLQPGDPGETVVPPSPKTFC